MKQIIQKISFLFEFKKVREPRFVPIQSHVFIRIDKGKRYNVKLLYISGEWAYMEDCDTKETFRVLTDNL